MHTKEKTWVEGSTPTQASPENDNSDYKELLSGSQDGILSCKKHGMPAKYSDWQYSGAHGCYVDVPYCEKCLNEAEDLHLETGREEDHEGVQR